MIKISVLVFLAIEIIILIVLKIKFWSNFDFGYFSMLIFMMLNIMMISIRVFVIDSTTKPKNDPGIFIWWCCCLKLGQRGTYSENYRLKVIH